MADKVKWRKFSVESEKKFGIGGKSETGGKCIIASEGMDAPAAIVYVHLYSASLSMSLSEALPVCLATREKTGFEVRGR